MLQVTTAGTPYERGHQYGTQLDPPAHWDEFGATISDLPASFTLRPLVVIDIHEQVAQDEGYHATVDDIISPLHRIERGYMAVPEAPGLGVNVDEHKIAKFRLT